MTERRRVAAVIIRDGCVLMVRERHRGPTDRHDGCVPHAQGAQADLLGHLPPDRVGHAPSGGANRHTFGGLADGAFRMVSLIEGGRNADWPWAS